MIGFTQSFSHSSSSRQHGETPVVVIPNVDHSWVKSTEDKPQPETIPPSSLSPDHPSFSSTDTSTQSTNDGKAVLPHRGVFSKFRSFRIMKHQPISTNNEGNSKKMSRHTGSPTTLVVPSSSEQGSDLDGVAIDDGDRDDGSGVDVEKIGRKTSPSRVDVLQLANLVNRRYSLADCPAEILLHILSFVLTSVHTSKRPITPVTDNSKGSLQKSENIADGLTSPNTFSTSSSSTSRSGRNSCSVIKRPGCYPKLTHFPKELTRDYFSMMLTCRSFASLFDYDPDEKDQMKYAVLEGFWEYLLMWHFVYPNFDTMDKIEEYMTDLKSRKSNLISYRRIYEFVNYHVQKKKVVIPKKKHWYDTSDCFYLLVAGVNSLVVQTIRALFFESK